MSVLWYKFDGINNLPNTHRFMSHANAYTSWNIQCYELFWNPLTPNVLCGLDWACLSLPQIQTCNGDLKYYCTVIFMWCGGPAVKPSKEIFNITLINCSSKLASINILTKYEIYFFDNVGFKSNHIKVTLNLIVTKNYGHIQFSSNSVCKRMKEKTY